MRLAVLTLVLASLSVNLYAAPKGRRSRRASHPAANGAMHVVRKGETGAKVARDNGLSLQELKRLNPGLNLARLSVGTRLRVGSAPAAASPARVEETGPAPASAPAVPLTPLAALPAGPDIAPAPMPHLEGLQPYRMRIPLPSAATASARLDTHQTPASTEDLLARMRPVVPPVSEAELNALLPTFTPADPDHLDLLWPVETRTISSAWGPRMRTKMVRVKNQRKKRIRYRGRHKGVDLTAPMGTAIYAAMDGKVIMAARHRQYGNYVIIDHGNGVMTLYAHAKLNLVHEGDIVRRGQKIAEVGRTGNATGPHLHFELRVDGVQQNPLPALDDEEEIPAEMAAQNAALDDARR